MLDLLTAARKIQHMKTEISFTPLKAFSYVFEPTLETPRCELFNFMVLSFLGLKPLVGQYTWRATVEVQVTWLGVLTQAGLVLKSVPFMI